ncbi:MAG TPA: response regulator, partial [candidate division WOR-3 bacterium]|nr:response regulator [candidate division WOR-3 bacterium]
VLCGWEMHAEAAADAPSARAAMARSSFDVALVDLVMPGVDGIELIRQLGPRHPETRFFLMTAYDECERALEAESEHGIRVIAKPVDLALLLKYLHTAAEARPVAVGTE